MVLVCLGAPFGAGGRVDPIWRLPLGGAILGPTGGYLAGFLPASYIMGRCAEAGSDRPRSFYRMLPWMLAAEAAIYACGLFWLPFGLAISAGVSPAAICPAAAGAGPCLKNIFSWGFVPFVPGEAVKMLLVWAVVPAAWQAVIAWHRWRHQRAPLPPAATLHDDGGGGDEDDDEPEVGSAVLAPAAGGAAHPAHVDVELTPARRA